MLSSLRRKNGSLHRVLDERIMLREREFHNFLIYRIIRDNVYCLPQRAEEWVETHRDDTLLRFFLTHKPAAKGAIIVNSVASAQRLIARLRPVFETQGL